MDINTWLEQHFNPWQNAMKQRVEEEQLYTSLVKSNARGVKHVLALIHAGSSAQAAAAWNNLGFPVTLKAITLSADGHWLEITTTDNNTTALPLNNLLEVLRRLLAG